MKKKRNRGDNAHWVFLPKLYRIMRLLCLLMIVGLMQVSAASFSQNSKLNLNLKNLTIEDVLGRIEDQTDYSFFYNSQKVDLSKVVNIEVKDESIEEVLNLLMEETGLSYTVNKKLIIIHQDNSLSQSGLLTQTLITLHGKVTDSSGAPLPGVTVVVKGTTNGTITNFDGVYNLSDVPSDGIVQFSFVGMRLQEILVGGKTSIDVIMEEDAIGLEEVVAIGYGTQKKINLTGSVSAVQSEQLTVAPVANVTNSLAGRLPGLVAKQESGQPGRDQTNLSIRGYGAPLVIVDGVEAEFSTLDANQIESITILKDASAAIYGARAGNGVVLVTTKRGNIGKPVIELKTSWTFQGVTNMPELTSSGQRAELIREAHLNAGYPESTARFSQEDVDLFYAGTNPDYPNTDWWKIAARDWSPQQQYNLSVRGGSDKIKYYGYLGYLDQETMFKNGGEYNRYNLQSNIDASITDNLSLQLDLSGIFETNFTPDRDLNSTVWQEYWVSEPFWTETLPNGKLSYAGAGAGIGIHYFTNMDYTGYYKTDETDLKATISLKYDFNKVKGLSAKVLGNYHNYYNFHKSFSYLSDSWSYNYSNDTYTQWTSATPPILIRNTSRDQVLTGQFSLNYDRIFAEKHEFSALLLYEMIDYFSDNVRAERRNYTTTAIDYLFAGAVDSQFANGSAFEMGRKSYIGRINYSFKSKYLVETTLRIDESAKFDKGERTGIFPGVSLGWRLSEENFIKDNVSTLENLKLRASYSQSGNDNVGNFRYLSGYGYGRSYIIGSSVYTGLESTGLANPFLTWEKMTTYNLGLDFSLSRRKFFGELDFFYRDRDGIPGTQVKSLPASFGATLPTVNLNSISTRGFDLMLGNTGQLDDFKWNITANISYTRSKWEYYDEPDYEDKDSKRLNKFTGRWTDVVFGYKSDGLFTSQEEIDALTFVYDETAGNEAVKPGTIKYIDTNNDGLLNWRDQVEIGKGTTPHWMIGFNLNVDYKNFDLSALFQGALGFNYNVLGSTHNKITTSYSLLQYEERWTENNNHIDGLLPRIGVDYTEYPSDFYYKKANYLRLKTLSFGYNIPSSILSKINLEKCRVYFAGTNLLTFSGLNKYSVDPEAPSDLGGYYYPQMRTISFGINLSF